MARWRDYLEPVDEPASVADRPEPERDVPPALGVLFGSQVGWSPAREGRARDHCDVCGNGEPHTPIQPGSRIVCMSCFRYGLDDQVRALLAITPAKPRHRPCVVKPRPKRSDRKCSS